MTGSMHRPDLPHQIPPLDDESQQRLEWRMRSFAWLLQRINGTAEDKEQFLAMWNAAIERSFYEGTIEAASLVSLMAEGITNPVPLDYVAGKIRELAEKNWAENSEAAL